ncbi:MAG: ABC transporter ATP-binding protein [Candidatus Methanomethylophilaceae archaeon]|nr:ABC transporter ATP-binding protein [Candidatus Methanomethylophilaceae archaeon]MDY0224230.1 ABC transporter ATP-binding protein [Candidatus Methanomethylophilaceae archaeon]
MSDDNGERRNVLPGRGPGHGLGAPVEKAKNFKIAWKKLFVYMKSYKVIFIGAVILAAIGTMLTLVGPNKLSDITNIIEEGIISGTTDLGAISAIGVFLIIIYGISAILSFLQGYILATVSQRTARNLRDDISKKINRLPLKYFDSSSTGDVLSRVTNDADTIGQSMNQSISTLVTAITLLVGSLIMMTVTNLTMMATVVLSTLVGFGLMFFIMGRSQKYFAIQQKNLGAMNGHVEEIYSGHNIVKVYNGEKQAKEKFDAINDNLFKSGFKSQFLSGLMMPLMNFIGNIGYVAVCIVGAILVLNGAISFGIIVAFMIYVRLFTQPLSQIAQAVTGMQSVAAATERVFEFLEEPELNDESEKKTVLKNVKGDVEFREIHFGYSPDKEVIHGFSANIKAGQKIAIVGPTGAGKTTLVNLLMRFYEVNSGDILIDGVSTKELTRENVHDLFCMVLQDTWIFDGTIRDNIIYCKEGITEEQVEAVAKSVGIHHFIMTLPDGYDTVLSDKTTLSAGQKQQITIARAMIENAPLLILDEATSSVDTRTEKHIQEAMDKLTEGRTSFVIAHRLSTIKNANLILVMRNGSIIESGTHKQLLADGGFYCNLYNSQFEEAEMD